MNSSSMARMILATSFSLAASIVTYANISLMGARLIVRSAVFSVRAGGLRLSK
jgi:hypothetical protein